MTSTSSAIPTISKTEKFDLKSIAVATTGRRSPLRNRIEALNVGEGFTAMNIERDKIAGVISYLKRANGSVYITKRTAAFAYQVIRIK